MRLGAKFIGTAAILSVAACGGEQGKLQIRSTPTPLAAGSTAVPLRIAEARGQFALGNVGLALEAFRIALRDDPNSIDAMMGVAACYDRMTRFDLSRRQYEAALAIAPGDPTLLTAFAVSLDAQGRAIEAASVRQEVKQRLALAAASQVLSPAPAAPIRANPPQAVRSPEVVVAQAAPARPAPQSVVAPPAMSRALLESIAKKPVPATGLVQASVAAAPAAPVRAALSPVAPAQAAPALVVPAPIAVAQVSQVPAALAPVAQAPVGQAPVMHAQPAPAQRAPIAIPTPAAAPRQVAASPPIGHSVTIALPPARPVPVAPPSKPAVESAAAVALPASPLVQPAIESSVIMARAERDAARSRATPSAGPRLERISMREVALITTPGPQWRPLTIGRTQRSATVRFIPLREASMRPANIRLLNAARVDRLAARTRKYLAGYGWRALSIGDAAVVRNRSVILYPAERRRTAKRLAAQFGFAMVERPGARQVTILLGRDAARGDALRSRG